MFLNGFYKVRDYYNVNRWEIIEAGAEVDRITPKDALVIAPYNGDTAFLYQTKRWGWPYLDRSIEEEISKGADYFVSVDLSDKQTIDIENKYQTIEKNSRFVIIDLHKNI